MGHDASSARAQGADANAATVTAADYQRAETFLPWNVQQLVFRDVVDPQWIRDEGSSRFWYRVHTPAGPEFVLVDPAGNGRQPAFDQAALAAALSRASGIATTAATLPFETIEPLGSEGGARWRFTAHKRRWVWDTASNTLEEVASAPEHAGAGLRSPDGQWEAFTRDGNLWLRSVTDGDASSDETQVTSDAEEHWAYADQAEGRTTTISDQLLKRRPKPNAVWSPDSQRLLFNRVDQRAVRTMHLIQSVQPDSNPRPKLHTYRMPLPGDAEIGRATLHVVDVSTPQTVVDLQIPALQAVAFVPPQRTYAAWSADSSHISVIEVERGFQASTFWVADPTTGVARKAVEERGQTLTVPHLSPTSDLPMVWISRDGSEALWFSQRDGWGHLYHYTADADTEPAQVTSGPWVVRELVYVDEDARSVFFTASGMDPARDPYERVLYRVDLDDCAAGPQVVLDAHADLEVRASPDGGVFLVMASRPDLPPVHTAYIPATDTQIALETADVTALLATGWQPPQRLRLPGRDGVADVWAVIIRPTNYDPTRQYPVLDLISPGPQKIQAPVGFPATDSSPISGFWSGQAHAELGCIVVLLDGAGQPYRSKHQHDQAYRNFEDGGGLADHISAMQALARQDPSLDLQHVGIYGHSGGGYASVRALLAFPEFYKVAVSSAGNHDNRGYMSEWGEMYLGMPDDAPDAWDAQTALGLAHRLQGKLMLAWGELDDNVHPALTIRMLDAFIKAGKDVDVVVVPSANHSFSDLSLEGRDTKGWGANNRYFIRKRWDFLVRHLMRAEPPQGYVIGGGV